MVDILHIFFICIRLLSNFGREKLVIFYLSKAFYDWISLRKMNTKYIDCIFLIIWCSIHKIYSCEFTYLSTILMIFIESFLWNCCLLSKLFKEMLCKYICVFREYLFAFWINYHLLVFVFYITNIFLKAHFRL